MLLNRKNCRAIQRVLEAQLAKLAIKTPEPCILFISFLQTSELDVIIDFRIDSTSLTVQRHDDLIKARAMR